MNIVIISLDLESEWIRPYNQTFIRPDNLIHISSAPSLTSVSFAGGEWGGTDSQPRTRGQEFFAPELFFIWKGSQDSWGSVGFKEAHSWVLDSHKWRDMWLEGSEGGVCGREQACRCNLQGRIHCCRDSECSVGETQPELKWQVNAAGTWAELSDHWCQKLHCDLKD